MNDEQINPNPELSCDIIMKGGVTSGIVYPKSIYELAKSYRFVNIGGTSAGAIAASLTAAAEYRRRNDSIAGFDKLEKITLELFKRENNITKLLSLFKPTDSAEKIFKLFLIFAKKQSILKKVINLILNIILQNRIIFILTILLLITSIIGSFGIPNNYYMMWVIFSLFVGFSVSSLILSILITLKGYKNILQRNNFGLTKGYNKDENEPALTSWLYQKLKDISGVANRPLTFGDLIGEKPEKKILLSVMTTNLSHGIPYSLPFDDSLKNKYYFDPDEFGEYFNYEIIDWMKDNSKNIINKKITTKNGLEEKTLYLLPHPDSLPVIVAVRMSLSFPLLISAVPLYTQKIKDKDNEENSEQMKRCWFSDGGICSNIPMHFFDSPLPSRPTFIINLRKFPDYVQKDKDESNNIFMPSDNRDGLNHEWNQISFSLGNFVSSIIKTMQNWNDNSHVRMPGFRDRICTVFLNEEEGGLNLEMDDTVLEAVSERGKQAGILLKNRFVPPGDKIMNWDNHRWIRFRISITLITKHLRNFMSKVYAESYGNKSYLELLNRDENDSPSSYPIGKKEARNITNELEKLKIIINEWESKSITFADEKSPKPKPELKIRAKL